MNQSTEEMIQARGLTAPRIRPEDLQAEIVKAEYHCFEGTTVTVCCLFLRNGFNVIGHSACADPANFDAEIGRKIAREHAEDQMWPLLGYNLRDKLHNIQMVPVEVVETTALEVVPAFDGPSKPVELGDQVYYYEQVEGRIIDPMIGTVTAVLSHDRVNLTVFSPNGMSHPRTNIQLVYPWTTVEPDALFFARPK